MTPRDYWTMYVDTHGSVMNLSKRLNIPYSTLAGVCNGSRGIGLRLAKRLHEADPLLDIDKLVWVKAVKHYGKAA